MNSIPLLPSLGRFVGQLALTLGLLATATATDLNPPRPLAPARGHYEKLARLDPAPARSNLPVDELRFANNPGSVERVANSQPEFVRLVLNEIKLPAMPANSSAQTRAELDYLLRLQADRTAAEGERALYFAGWGYSLSVRPGDPTYAANRANLFFVGRSVGSWFNANSLPLTADLMGRMWRDAAYHVWSLKFQFSRVRPVVIDPRIKNLQETDWAAFPSGHSSFAHILAYLYSELAPEFADIFLKDARDIAHSREIIGVHFPSDSEAGRMLAQQFVNALLHEEKFRAEFAQVRAEWTRVRAASAD